MGFHDSFQERDKDTAAELEIGSGLVRFVQKLFSKLSVVSCLASFFKF